MLFRLSIIKFTLRLSGLLFLKMGEDVLLQPNIPPVDEARLFPRGVRKLNLPSGLAYVRYTADYPMPHECWE